MCQLSIDGGFVSLLVISLLGNSLDPSLLCSLSVKSLESRATHRE